MTDRLRQAVTALREVGAEPGDSAANTRMRVMMSLHAGKRRRAKAFALLVPVFAILVGSTAWAAASGKMPAVWRRVSAALGVTQPAPAPPKKRLEKRADVRGARNVSEHRTEAAPIAETAAPAELTAEATESTALKTDDNPPNPAQVSAKQKHAESATPIARRQGAVPSVSRDEAIEAPAVPSVDEQTLALYRRAHRAHFVEHDYAKAIAAWNDYLAAAPDGRFAPEARYNRAIALVRVGHHDEARRALEPFAQGRMGTYRQAEARALLDELPDDVTAKTQK